MKYFDGCYIAKYYLAEPDSGVVIAAMEAGEPVACSAAGKLEAASVFHRKLREGIIDIPEYHLLRAQFQLDCAAGLWTWLPVTPHLIDQVFLQYGIVPPHVFIRSGDALHLVCAAEKGFTEIYSSDRHLLAAAPHFGLKGIKL